MERLNGIGVSPGVAVGRAIVLTQRSDVVRFPIPPERVAREVAALEAARDRSREQLQDIRTRIASARGHELASLFDAQILILDDPLFFDRAADLVRTERVNAAWAVHRAYEELCEVFATVEDAYLRERESDVADVAGRVRLNLRHQGTDPGDLLRDVDGPCLLVADELTASLAAQLDWNRIQGFATDAGSRTYHTAILARSLKVPAVVGLHDASTRITAGTPLVIDGTTGELIVDPTPDALAGAQERATRRPRVRPAPLAGGAPATVATADGVPIRLEVNIELLEDLPAIAACGAEGVGLYRSEFMLGGLPLEEIAEDRQFEVYRALVTHMAPRPVTIRTFDLDERQVSARGATGRRSSRRGLRGVRLGLARPDLLRTQLRALVRAAAFGPLRVMFPFVTAVEEVRQARALMREAAASLGVDAGIPVGIMIEVPAAAVAADLLAPEVDFFTIGTNDLIQYTLAVDRTDDRVSEYYEPLHPAMLRLLRLVRRAAARQGIPVSVCGEMASDPALLGLLVGLGLTSFSMTPAALPMAREVVLDLHAGDARRLAREVLRLSTAADVEHHLFDALAAAGSRRDGERRR
ncbi:MAG: phosphoenolpyruvate--protein phosphotransferase [Vicinamibacterales bacterium]|nr:phosphoenolpyruvate--protein phosphotransferase [Vicinamibacterales bacterium]